jgi:hypothetical protein
MSGGCEEQSKMNQFTTLYCPAVPPTAVVFTTFENAPYLPSATGDQ